MNKRLFFIIVIALALSWLGWHFVDSAKNTAATVQSSALYKIKNFFFPQKASNNPVVCIRDANNDGVIKFFEKDEFTFKGSTDCAKLGGAPGMSMWGQEVTSVASFNSSHFQTLAAATKAVTTESSKTAVSGLDTNTKSTTNTDSSKTTGTTAQIGVSATSQVNVIGVVKGAPRVLTPQELGQVNADRKRIGLDKKKYKPGEYECTAFSRDLEKSNPEKYTVTVALCKVTLKCTMPDKSLKKLIITGGHMFNDVHMSKTELGYIEPQTGKNIDPDFDGNGKFSSPEIWQIDGVQGQITVIANRLAPGCGDVEVLKGPDCAVKSYEDTAAAYKDLGPVFFPNGYNPN